MSTFLLAWTTCVLGEGVMSGAIRGGLIGGAVGAAAGLVIYFVRKQGK